MALPFVLGLALGAGAIVAYNKSDKLKNVAGSFFNKSKDVACSSLEKGKETVDDVKQTINATAECIKEKKEQAALEEKEEKIKKGKSMKQPLINTGEPRNVLGHIVSGAVASALVSGTINYKKLKDRKISPNDAIKDTVKKTSQGAIATGTAIATANYIGQKGGLFKALSAVSIGMAGVYALELIDNKLEEKYEFIEGE